MIQEFFMFVRDAIPQILSRGTALLSQGMLSATTEKTFHHPIDVYLKDSNAFMNTYFARYFEWQGVCRERWFHDCVHNNLLAAGGMFVTKRAHQEYVHETFPFQRVDCYLNTFQVRQCSAYLLFRFCVDGNPVSMGYQQILFTDTNRRIQRFPAGIIERVKEYELIMPANLS
jgi:enediyne core biosynthesis thioesterase